MPVKIFHVSSLTNIEKNMPKLEDEINKFEKELDTQGREINFFLCRITSTRIYS